MMEIAKILNTVRYMTPRQWAYRLYYTVRSKQKKRKPKEFESMRDFYRLPTYYSENIENLDAIGIANDICKGIIPTVYNKSVHFNGDWDLKGENYRLVSFRLNSFRWLLDLSDAYKVTNDWKYIRTGFDYIADWYNKCGYYINGDKWNAYVIAERITNWIGFVSEYGNEQQIYEINKWIHSQAQELKESIEYHLGANHLLSEAKALVYAGTFLNDTELYNTGKKILFVESKEQFYLDGGHYEQSVSYHVESLQQYFEVYAVLRLRNDSDADGFYVSWLKQPYRFLNGIIGVNGRIPLFNDAAYDYPFYDAADFLYTASYIYRTPPDNGRNGNYSKRWKWLTCSNAEIDWKKEIWYKNTGFIHYPFKYDGKRYSFFMDCGNNGPDYNLGHAHADALSILLYSEDKELLVDSGVFTYQPGAKRNACRSTKAHNTVEVDDINSAEVWSAFRVAKRGYSTIMHCVNDDCFSIKAFHDGYTKCLKDPVVHIRTVDIKGNNIIIFDDLKCKDHHKAISRFHISPQCKVVLIDSHTCLIDENITIKSERAIVVKDCIVAGFFGETEAAKCLEIDFSGANSLKTEFTIV